jgi:hypothetical protein
MAVVFKNKKDQMKKIIFLFVVAILAIVGVAVYAAIKGMFGLFIPFVLLFPATILVFVFSLIRKSRRNREILLRTGEPAKARVLSISETGVMINHNPRVAIHLEVTPLNKAPFNATAYIIVSLLQPLLYQPGMILQVRYDPKDLSKVAIESSAHEVNAVQNKVEMKPLLCPTCGGQVTMNESAYNEKMITCSYCGTVIEMNY